MDVTTAILTRRSHHHLNAPAPGDQEFAYLLSAAATAPDHGQLRPWRWVLIRGAARYALGACFADQVEQQRREQAAAKALRAPLLATLVFTPRLGHKIPEWEQLAATSAMTQSLILLLHSRGFGSMWRTGTVTESTEARQLFGLHDSERLLGWLCIGTPDPAAASGQRKRSDITPKLFTLSDGQLRRYHPAAPNCGRDTTAGTWA